MRLFRTEEAASRIAVFVLGQNVAIQDLSRIFKTDGIPQVVSRQALVLRCRVRLPQAILIRLGAKSTAILAWGSVEPPIVAPCY